MARFSFLSRKAVDGERIFMIRSGVKRSFNTSTGQDLYALPMNYHQVWLPGFFFRQNLVNGSMKDDIIQEEMLEEHSPFQVPADNLVDGKGACTIKDYL